MIVVTRYFGGKKLGTGGLIRAYGECAEAVIKKSKIVERPILKNVTIIYPFNMIKVVRHLVQKYGAKISENATNEGMSANIKIKPSVENRFREELIANSAGRIEIL